MFIIKTISKEEANFEIKEVYDKMEKTLGFLPPHTQLFATIDLHGMKEFIKLNIYLHEHKRINSDILPIIRLFIASKDCRKYCKTFNTKLLLAKGEKKNILKNITNNINEVSLDDNQKLLTKKVLKAIYEEFTQEDLKELENANFQNQDFYDVLNYATTFMAKSKIIDTYIKDK